MPLTRPDANMAVLVEDTLDASADALETTKDVLPFCSTGVTVGTGSSSVKFSGNAIGAWTNTAVGKVG